VNDSRGAACLGAQPRTLLTGKSSCPPTRCGHALRQRIATGCWPVVRRGAARAQAPPPARGHLPADARRFGPSRERPNAWVPAPLPSLCAVHPAAARRILSVGVGIVHARGGHVSITPRVIPPAVAGSRTTLIPSRERAGGPIVVPGPRSRATTAEATACGSPPSSATGQSRSRPRGAAGRPGRCWRGY
jgi:hypothetical protein